MKSSSAASAHCRSSKTSTVGLCSARRSKKSRQPAKRSSRSADAELAEAEQVRQPRLDPGPLLGVGHVPLDRRRGASRRRGRGLFVLGDARAHAHHLGERPERDAVAVGEAAATVPADVVGEAVDVLLELPREPRLADARRSPSTETSLRLALVVGRVEEILDSRSSPSRPTNGGSRASPRRSPAAAGDDPERPPERSGSALPFSSCSPASSYAIAASLARLRRSPTSTVPGSAADWTRDAVLTRSPATMPWPSAPSVTAASPVSDAGARLAAPGSSAGARPATSSSAARTARSASSSCATGVPQTAITASPMNFSTVPP